MDKRRIIETCIQRSNIQTVRTVPIPEKPNSVFAFSEYIDENSYQNQYNSNQEND